MQCLVEGIGVFNPDIINVITRRLGRSSAFRSTDGGLSWTPIADSLTQANPLIDITCVAVHPSDQNVIYLGGGASQSVYVSTDGGGSWPVTGDPHGQVRKIIVDPHSPPNSSMARLYTATDPGISTSTDGGNTWTLQSNPVDTTTPLAQNARWGELHYDRQPRDRRLAHDCPIQPGTEEQEP